jgi:hypothetical protein
MPPAKSVDPAHNFSFAGITFSVVAMSRKEAI